MCLFTFPCAEIFSANTVLDEKWKHVWWCVGDLYMILVVLCVVTLVTRVCAARIAGLPFRRSHVAFLLLLTVIVGVRILACQLFTDYTFLQLKRKPILLGVVLAPSLASSSVFSMLVFHVGVVLRTIYVAYEQVLHPSIRRESTLAVPHRPRPRRWCTYWFMCCGKARSTLEYGLVSFNVVMWSLFLAGCVRLFRTNDRSVFWLLCLSSSVDLCMGGAYFLAALRLRRRLKVLGRMLEPRDQISLAISSREPSVCREIPSGELVLPLITTSSTRERIEDEEEEQHAAGFHGGRAAPLAPKTSDESYHEAADGCIGFGARRVSPPWSSSVPESCDVVVSMPSTISATDSARHGKSLNATHYTSDRRSQAGDVDGMCLVRVSTWPSLLLRKDRSACGSLEGLPPVDEDVHLSDSFHVWSRGISELSLRRCKSLPWCFQYAGKDADRAALGCIEDSETFNAVTISLAARSRLNELTSFVSMHETVAYGDCRTALGDLGPVVSGLRLILIFVFASVVTFAIRGFLLVVVIVRFEGQFPPKYFFFHICICEWIPYATVLIMYLVPGLRAACSRRSSRGGSVLESTY
eukprot:TRINITY_DN11701_c0_g2_i1.p1 TRINITY_DN11701_c0_g2~~TRINITY_DN11701_c0_g2_i1.p1  ORF type:complete len:581 (+),score=63.06 TRINITY_DN11701_c0_g2_i1:198-1940(+)